MNFSKPSLLALGAAFAIAGPALLPPLAAQNPAPPPSFEVASIRPAQPGGNRRPAQSGVGVARAGGRVDLRSVTLAYLVIQAFELQPDQVRGPDWLNAAFFDVSAVAPAGTPKEKIPLMLQDLLAARFNLKYHRESADSPAYHLVVGSNGPKLAPGIPDDDPGNLGQIGATSEGTAPGAPVTATARTAFGIYQLTVADGMAHYQFRNITMRDFAAFLNFGGRGPLGLPVVDMTAMTGRYQVALDVSQSEMHGPAPRLPANPPETGEVVPAASEPSGASIRTSLEKQGLRLTRRNARLEWLVIDHIERTPTAN